MSCVKWTYSQVLCQQKDALADNLCRGRFSKRRLPWKSDLQPRIATNEYRKKKSKTLAWIMEESRNSPHVIFARAQFGHFSFETGRTTTTPTPCCVGGSSCMHENWEHENWNFFKKHNKEFHFCQKQCVLPKFSSFEEPENPNITFSLYKKTQSVKHLVIALQKCTNIVCNLFACWNNPFWD